MSALIAKVRQMIGDPSGSSQQFSDDDIQAYLDANRDDVRYENLQIAPSIVNNTNTNNQADTIFADFYSRYGYWEADLTLQAYSNGAAWVVVTPVAMELLIDQAHFQFETNVFASGTAPGQLPPVFATGKIYDPFACSADLLEMWAATMTGAYDISVDGQSLKRSQMPQAKLTLAQQYRKRARPKVAKMVRSDLMPAMDTQRMRLLDSGDLVK
jgi:hypothetical protein